MQEISLENRTLEDLRYIAKVIGLKNIAKYKKSELLEKILEVSQAQNESNKTTNEENTKNGESSKTTNQEPEVKIISTFKKSISRKCIQS